jgi:hypothetical protein
VQVVAAALEAQVGLVERVALVVRLEFNPVAAAVLAVEVMAVKV